MGYAYRYEMMNIVWNENLRYQEEVRILTLFVLLCVFVHE